MVTVISCMSLAPLFLCGYLEWYQVSWDALISQSEYVINRMTFSSCHVSFYLSKKGMTTKLFMQVCVAYIQTSGGIFKCGLWPYPALQYMWRMLIYTWRFLLNLPLLFSIMKHYKDIVGWRTSCIRRNSDLPKVLLSAWILFLWLGTGPSDCNLINKASFWLISGRIILMKNIRMLYMKNTARLMMKSSVSLLQLKTRAQTS